ncbi:MAG: hypothetical protein EAX96_06080 [Candidatus Lokiarchaeota archaeon]|nr:hypothetical protein [Candidatus Lokiarchaeota archaeon]
MSKDKTLYFCHKCEVEKGDTSKYRIIYSNFGRKIALKTISNVTKYCPKCKERYTVIILHGK